jgi:hypothetical protein
VLQLGLALASALPAQAAPEEIQVYRDELNTRGEVGLDVHVNDVLTGLREADHAGGQSALHRWRITPEFSYGLGSGFELGAYLPLATVGADGTLRAQGAKLRLKWLAPHGEEGFFWGANYEVGYSDNQLDANPWNNEAKLIGGWRRGKWQATGNVNVDFALSGPEKASPDVELASKFGYALSPKLTLGVESYNGMGSLRQPGHWAHNEHASYLVADTSLGKWDINFGIGRGYGANADHLVAKFIVGVPLGR